MAFPQSGNFAFAAIVLVLSFPHEMNEHLISRRPFLKTAVGAGLGGILGARTREWVKKRSPKAKNWDGQSSD